MHVFDFTDKWLPVSFFVLRMGNFFLFNLEPGGEWCFFFFLFDHGLNKERLKNFFIILKEIRGRGPHLKLPNHFGYSHTGPERVGNLLAATGCKE